MLFIRRKLNHLPFQVSSYQMCILMLFNRQQTYTYQDIQTESNIPEKVMIVLLIDCENRNNISL